MILWTLFMLVYTEFGLRGSILSAAVNTAAAALPGIAIWQFTKWYRWPESPRFAFYFAHIGIGFVFAGTWAVFGGVTAPFYLGITVAEYFSNPSTLLWRLIMGLFIYGCITGVSYAAHNYARLQRQTRKADRLEALALKAELDSLKARLSPHFIFNALHSISALVTKNTHEAELAIDRLGFLLRYVLEENGEPFIVFSEEWYFTQQYFELENMRLENSVQLIADISDDAMSFQIIPLILQPLVENAMKHARFTQAQDNYIKVRAHIAGNNLCLDIEDNGTGDNAGEDAESGGTHYGLSVLRERLLRSYNGDASVTVDDRGQQGFHVRLLIPRSDNALHG